MQASGIALARRMLHPCCHDTAQTIDPRGRETGYKLRCSPRNPTPGRFYNLLGSRRSSLWEGMTSNHDRRPEVIGDYSSPRSSVRENVVPNADRTVLGHLNHHYHYSNGVFFTRKTPRYRTGFNHTVSQRKYMILDVKPSMLSAPPRR